VDFGGFGADSNGSRCTTTKLAPSIALLMHWNAPLVCTRMLVCTRTPNEHQCNLSTPGLMGEGWWAF
jgi:hypothetical protein